MNTDVGSMSYSDQTMMLAKNILAERAQGVEFKPEDSLTDVGLSSLDLVNLMVAVEAEFDIMIPPAYLTPERFRSVSSIARMVETIRHSA